jgi:hypothetical protein
MENKTAVQWLYEAYRKEAIPTDAILELFKKAKEMEKEQIMGAVYYTCSSMTHYDLPCGNQYYNQTFKSE